MQKKKYAAIDPGGDGAVVVIDEDKRVVFKSAFPNLPGTTKVDTRALFDLVFEALTEDISHVILEDVHAIFNSAAGATFSFGYSKGFLEAAIIATQIPYTLVQPKAWQKVVWQGVPEIRKPGTTDKNGKARKGAINTKAMSLAASARIFPEEDFRKSARAKKPHDGIVDAVLMAEYCRRNF